MKEERYFYVPDASHQNELPKEEAQHALRVLRMQAGDEMFLMDGCGTFYQAEITAANTYPASYASGSDVARPYPSRHRADKDDGPHGMDDREMHRDRL